MSPTPHTCQMRRVGIAPPRSIIRASCASAMPTRCVGKIALHPVQIAVPRQAILPTLRRFRRLLRLPNPPPYLLAGERHVEVGDAEGGERIEHRADHRRRRADGPRFPAALGAERIMRAG